MKLFPITLVITFIPIEWRDYIWHQFRQLTNVFSYFINTSPRTTSASLYQFHLGYVMILLVKRPQSKPVCSQDRYCPCCLVFCSQSVTYDTLSNVTHELLLLYLTIL
jgi:hypothetical protein